MKPSACDNPYCKYDIARLCHLLAKKKLGSGVSWKGLEVSP
ncbi:hypothetical protein GPLA_4688 [Paraglaciecola polaris LMG 21857]|uniref:Uncharacterized protein n=1 Tax=Paraglaciecola polaris LMG 21857 TaxID=1129793 RepID=K6ZZC9_9ALTE|nr:hypothetical protein GPLA_4688 [Paraglaciecola polaris LMG 21857]